MQNDKYSIRVIRSRRKRRITMRFAPDGSLEIRAPEDIEDSFIKNMVAENSAAIARLQQRTPIKNKPDLSGKTPLLLLGEKYPLRFTHNLRIFDHAFLVPQDSPENIKISVITLYRELARIIISRRLANLERTSGLTPQKIRISGADTRWGSCSTAGTLSFSWKLIQCPPETVDYVIAHELSHLKEKNHSPKFWKLVQEIIPDYRKRRKQLNDFAESLPDWD